MKWLSTFSIRKISCLIRNIVSVAVGDQCKSKGPPKLIPLGKLAVSPVENAFSLLPIYLGDPGVLEGKTAVPMRGWV